MSSRVLAAGGVVLPIDTLLTLLPLPSPSAETSWPGVVYVRPCSFPLTEPRGLFCCEKEVSL